MMMLKKLLLLFICFTLGLVSGACALETQEVIDVLTPSFDGTLPAGTATLPASTAAPQNENPTSEPAVAIFTGTPQATDTQTPVDTQPPEEVRFAVIGDFGEGNQAEADVAALVKQWGPDFIITVGDNNYPSGSAETIDFNIGQHYHEFIYSYVGEYGAGSAENRFFPTIGNHDWDTSGGQAYFDYFELPGNERYYDFVRGPVHFFALNSDSREPDGVGMSSIQAAWLRDQLFASTSIWKVVYAHHPPYSSGPRGPVDWMRWPFQEWGASVYLAGHDHYYERLDVFGFPYLINGLGGGPIYSFGSIAEGSLVRYNADYGALFVVADSQHMIFQFATRKGQLIDTYQIER